MTCIPDRTSLQVSFYTPPDIPRQESSSTKVPSPSYDQIFTQTSCHNSMAAISYLERPNLNCQGTKPSLPFALFTTLLRRVRLSQGIRRLCGEYIATRCFLRDNTDFIGVLSDSVRYPSPPGFERGWGIPRLKVKKFLSLLMEQAISAQFLRLG